MKTFLSIMLILLSAVFCFAVPVDTDTTYPKITVIDTAGYYEVTINSQSGDSLFNIAYAWGTKPNIYAAVYVANDDTANWQFSVKESLRWEEIQQRTVPRWDMATYNKHPMNFVFMKNPIIINYTKQDVLTNGAGRFEIWDETQFNAIFNDTIVSPYIYIDIDGGNYFNSELAYSSINTGVTWMGSTYLGYFNDAAPGRSNFTAPEYLDECALHELNHYFVRLPQIQSYFDNYSHYNSVTAGNSPNGKAGDFEVYDPLNVDNLQGYLTDKYCAPLSQMCMNILSPYEDSGMTLSGGYYQNSQFYEQWNYYIDTTSSKYFYSQADTHHWNIRVNSNQISLPDSTRKFLIPKSNQQNRSLLVFASDSLHPGYFKCFSLGAQSEVMVINNPVPSGVRRMKTEGGMANLALTITPNPFKERAVISYAGTWSGTAGVFDLNGKLIRNLTGNKNKFIWDGTDGNGIRVKAGVYILKMQRNGQEYSRQIMFLR